MNGANGIGWDESVPADTESLGLTDDRIKSVKTSVRAGLDDEHNFPSAGGNNVGYHRLGSARPYYGPQSAVSSAGTDGRLMHASDTSRLFGVGSGGTTLLGGPTVLLMADFAGTVPQRHYWAVEIGGDTTSSDGSRSVTIPNSGFSGIPRTFLQLRADSVASAYGVSLGLTPVSGSQFVVTSVSGGVYAASQEFFWVSIGTRVL